MGYYGFYSGVSDSRFTSTIKDAFFSEYKLRFYHIISSVSPHPLDVHQSRYAFATQKTASSRHVNFAESQ